MYSLTLSACPGPSGLSRSQDGCPHLAFLWLVSSQWPGLWTPTAVLPHAARPRSTAQPLTCLGWGTSCRPRGNMCHSGLGDVQLPWAPRSSLLLSAGAKASVGGQISPVTGSVPPPTPPPQPPLLTCRPSPLLHLLSGPSRTPHSCPLLPRLSVSPSVAQSFSVTLPATPSFSFLLPCSPSLPLSASPLAPSLLPATHFTSFSLILAFHPLTVFSLSLSLHLRPTPLSPLFLLASHSPCSPLLLRPPPPCAPARRTPSVPLPAPSSRTCPGDGGVTHKAPVGSQGRRPDGRGSVGSCGRRGPRRGIGP